MSDIVVAKEVEICSLIKPIKKYKTVNAGKVYKVVDKDEKYLHVVFFAKVRKKVFKSNRSLLATYKSNKKRLPLSAEVDLVGKDIHVFESKKAEKFHKQETKKLSNKIKLERDISDYIDEQIKIAMAEEKGNREKLFLAELSKLEKKGILFMYEHKEFTLSEIARISSKKLSSEGWSFCFEYQKGDETLYHFQRPIRQKKVASS